MYFLLANWVKRGGQLPNDQDLREELLAVEYTFTHDKLRVIEKDLIKDVIGRSPDKSDALALTFAYPVSPKLPFGVDRGSNGDVKGHDPFAFMRE